MESMLSADEKDQLISTFLEIAVGQNVDIATHFLEVFYLILSVFFPCFIVKFVVELTKEHWIPALRS